MLVAQLCPTLCHPMDGSPPGSSVHGIFQARVLEWIAISSSRGSSWPSDGTQVSCIAGRFFTVWVIKSILINMYEVKLLSRVWLFATPWAVACTRLLRPWDFLGKSTGVGCHFSRESSQPRDRTQVSRIVDRCFTIWATSEVLRIWGIWQI